MATAAILRRPRNDLQKLTEVVAIVVGVFGVLVVGIMIYAGVVANRSALDRDKVLLGNALDQSISRVLNEQKSVSWWDDSVVNTVINFNKDWIDWNIGTFLIETYGHEEIYILSDADKLIYSMKDAKASDVDVDARMQQLAPVIREIRGQPPELLHRNDLFAAAQKTYDQLSKVLAFAKWSGHILDLGGKPALVSVITIAPNTDMGLATGTPYLLVSVVYIDDEFIADLSRSLLIPDLRLSKSGAGIAGTFSEPFITDDGSEAGVVSWTPRQPGRILLTIILPLVVVGLLVFGFFTAITLRRLRRASTELADREADALHRSRHDALSSLPNRFFFTEVAARIIGEQMNSRGVVTLAYLDIDRFKDINDTLGHHAGDELIRAVANRLKTFIGESDFLARFGGDELAVLRICTSNDTAVFSDLLLRAFCTPFGLFGQRIKISASVGLVTAPKHGVNVEELMRKADIALYKAKAEGRDRAVSYTEEMGQNVEIRRSIELDLRQAIEKNQLSLFYQPIVTAKSYDVGGIEALLRWQHPTRGNIPPMTFIPIAEESGLMPALGAWVLERAFLDHALWPEFEMSINLSPDQFRHVDLEHLLQELVRKYSVDTSKIVLEITESLLLESSPRVHATLKAIKDMGFKIALDDFGTGYSSLTYLRTFTFDKLKIDRSFVSGLPEAQNSRTIVRAIVNLGRALDIEIVAEGVETEAEAAMMRLFGCTALQGYFFSKPVDKEACDALLQAQRQRLAEAAATPQERLLVDSGLRGR
jgi:diguanylate cyclase (GGDEF)-like protein